MSSIHGTDDASHIWCICFVQNWTAFLTQCSIGDNTQLDVIMAVNSDDFVCFSDEDALNHSDTLVVSNAEPETCGRLDWIFLRCTVDATRGDRQRIQMIMQNYLEFQETTIHLSLRKECTIHISQTVGKFEFCGMMKGGQVRLSLSFIYMNLGIQLKDESLKWPSPENLCDASVWE